MNPSPITLGGVPMGVASPPTEAANDVISIMPVAYRRSIVPASGLAGSYRNLRIDSPIASIIAVVAVFEIHAEMNAVTAPNANRIRPGRAPTQASDLTP